MVQKKVIVSVEKASQLVNLPIDQKKAHKIQSQLNETITYITRLNRLDTAKTQPTSQVTGLTNISAPDEPKPSLTTREALQNATRSEDEFFSVPGIFEDEN